MRHIWMIGLALVLALAAASCGSTYSDPYYDSTYGYGAYGSYGTGYYDDDYRYGSSRYAPGHYGYYQRQPYAYGTQRYPYDSRVYRPGGPYDRPPVVVTPAPGHHYYDRRYID